MKLAEVYINIPIKRIAQAYTYIIPKELNYLSVGWRVIVPFARRETEGFIADIRELPDDADLQREAGGFQLQMIKACLDEEAWFTPELIKVSKWMADFYLCSPGEIMRLFMPGKSGVKIQLCYEAVPEGKDNMLLMVEMYRIVYDILCLAGAMSKKEINNQLIADGQEIFVADMDNILDKLVQYGLLRKTYQTGKRTKAVYKKMYMVQFEITENILKNYSRRPAQKKLLLFIRARQQTFVKGENNQLVFTKEEFAEEGISSAVIKALVENGVLTQLEERVYRDSYNKVVAHRVDLELTPEQKSAVTALERALGEKSYKRLLLYGVTGSGKTQVYIEAARKARSIGRRVIVLVPEIALTGQLVQAFKNYFTEDIIVMHSRLSIHERNDAILRVRQGQAGIIIGARSALFTPADNIGLVIMDEEQDDSYKQDESPRYHARVVAQQLCQLYGAVLLLGSATPSLETFYEAHKGGYEILKLPYRIGNRPLPQVKCVDMRQELKHGRKNVISKPLKDLIESTIAKGEQLILMLNRRGFSTFIMCRSCGEVIKCPDCTMPLVYHKDRRLMCHHCDRHLPVPDVCPKCGSRYIKYFGSGTEKLEQELRELVPDARIIRMDRDTTNSKFGHADIIKRFKDHEFDILLGTQMVAKGHDIPNVTAVGIISADSALNMPDFRAAERVFMLITQTAGRAGRGDIPGSVIVQSYSPEHNAVISGVAQDYESFARQELRIRHGLFFPPYCRIIKLIFQDQQEEIAREKAESLKKRFLEVFDNSQEHQVCGPAPAIISRLRGISRFAMLIKTKDLEKIQDFLRAEGVNLDMSVAIDIDPITTA